MFIVHSPVVDIIEIEKDIYLQKIKSPEIAKCINPGQFLNIKINDGILPLLRRPFSICDVEDDNIFIIFNTYGQGTKMLSRKPKGELLNILAPLGKGFIYNDQFDLAIFIAGGMGIAPFPFLFRKLNDHKNIISFIGAKTKSQLIKFNLPNTLVATEDGSEGFKGNVVQLFNYEIKNFFDKNIKIFACGPNPMLKALSNNVKDLISSGYKIKCEISTESAMACGFGICQGCPIEDANNPDNYLLVCKDGPVFNLYDIIL